MTVPHGTVGKGDTMRVFRRLAVIAAAAGLLLGPAAGIASAGARPAASAVHLTGGTTSVTTASGIAVALFKNGIVPVATLPGREVIKYRHGQVAAKFGFPVTGGKVTLSPLGGYITHSGGILFIDLATGKKVKVSDFVISLTHGNLTGIVNGNPKARVALFNLSLAHATLKASKHSVRASGIVVTLTKTAASALDAALGTKLFGAGLKLGTATTVLASDRPRGAAACLGRPSPPEIYVSATDLVSQTAGIIRLARSDSPLAALADVRTPQEAMARLKALDPQREMQVLTTVMKSRTASVATDSSHGLPCALPGGRAGLPVEQFAGGIQVPGVAGRFLDHAATRLVAWSGGTGTAGT